MSSAAAVVPAALRFWLSSALRTLKAQPSAGSNCNRNRLVVAESWLTAVYMVDSPAAVSSRTHADTVNGAVVSRTAAVLA
nr:hypothetical protein [Actinoplanes durhamensis]